MLSIRSVLVVLPLAVAAPLALAQPWSDNFDSYATGASLHGAGGWKGWDNNAGFTANTSSTQAFSAPNSVDIAGASDLVQTFSGATSGLWVFSGKVYVPGNFTGSSYFIMLNDYNDGGPYNWSLQIHFESGSGNLVSDYENATLAMVTDQWVDFRNEINLGANTQSFYYNNQLLVSKSWTEGVSGGGALNIEAVDLFANGASSVYYDDLSLNPVPEPFTMALGAAALAAGTLRRRRRA